MVTSDNSSDSSVWRDLSEEAKLTRVRHTLAHVMAEAVIERFSPLGRVDIATGPPTDTGFYYDFDLPRTVVEDDLTWLESRMREILAGAHPVTRRVITVEEAREMYRDAPYKSEVIEGILSGTADDHGEPIDIAEPPTLTTYTQDTFEDLCGGPHVDNTRDIATDAFKLTSVAGAYWRGDEKRPMLQRIHGTAWLQHEDLEKYLWQREQAEKRDHRKVGRELDLFFMDKTAPGMPYWLPDGWRLFNRLLDFWRREHELRGYQEISTPLVNERTLWDTSGHWDHYVDNMFVIPVDEHSTYGVKPMNCPNAMLVFNRQTTSYRDLPLRLSDCDVLHRHERSGTLQGLLRVQSFHQDDAHIFIAEDEIGAEYERIFEIADRFYSVFGLTYTLRLGTRPEKYIGDLGTWNRAESVLRDVLDRHAGPGKYLVEDGDGAFYGPKIDILMEDALGREWQMGTIQLDFQQPRRFGCTYIDATGHEVTPVVIHRVIYGSLERFIAILIEHTAGFFPPWLSPRQVVVLPVNDKEDVVDSAQEFVAQLQQKGLAAALVPTHKGALGARIRQARLTRIPYVIVFGKREVEGDDVVVNLRDNNEKFTLPRTDAIDRMRLALDRLDQTTTDSFADLLEEGKYQDD